MTLGKVLKRIVLGVVVVLLLLSAVSVVVRAVTDAPDEQVRTVTS
ncbi:MAG TPA: hypothetical protein VHF23_08115 [Gaiellaceae bacterium]|nr:hypothetical protein [Gaiellaceae bacterium]